MFCTQCGTALPENSAFCHQCGNSMSGVPAAGAPAHAAPTAASGDARLAGFWRRFAAMIVDGFVLAVPTYAVALVLFGTAFFDPTANTLFGSPLKALLYYLFSIGGGVLYAALMHSSSLQATVGKMAFGIKVTDLQGNRISLGRAVGRYFAMIVSAITLCIGYLMAAFTQRRQALHDLLAGTLVVSRDSTPEQIRGTLGKPKLSGGVIAMMVIFFWLPVAGVVAAIGIRAAGLAAMSSNGSSSSASGPAGGSAEAVSDYYVEIINNTGYTVRQVFVSPADSDDWEEDVLGDEVLRNGESRRINLNGYSSPMFDIRLVDEDGDTYTFMGVDVSEQDVDARPEDIDGG
ncbi:MAG: hypothetical protein RL026_124 [Pseudomonadota bacterium]|jgi:uncharacterized RDD family membrane protein YckC